MNTPAHVVINLVILSRPGSTRGNIAIFSGALLPDIPIFIFYFVERFILGTPEREIWNQSYYYGGWQYFIDVFNSVPLMFIGGVLAWQLRLRAIGLLFASMMIHVAFDLPFHHDDAHRHFLPFAEWRYSSPLSYWDSAHYGTLIGWVEFALVVSGCFFLYKRFDTKTARRAIISVGAVYISYLMYAMVVWG
jgi:hypothetical protein